MDPNVTLAEIRALIRDLREAQDDGDEGSVADVGANLAEKTEALDQWVTGGGFLPEAWTLAR